MNTNMNEVSNKEIKANRVKNIFITTAKGMIERDGIETVSIRKVAQKAGYAMSTIYVYFKNIDDLLWHTRDSMIGDIATYMVNKMPTEINTLEDVKAIFYLLMCYYIDNEKVYQFMYNYPLNKTDKKNGNIIDSSDIQKEFAKTFAFFMSSGRFTEEEITTKTSMLVYSMFGMLNLLITNNDDLQRSKIHNQMDAYIELLFGE